MQREFEKQGDQRRFVLFMENPHLGTFLAEEKKPPHCQYWAAPIRGSYHRPIYPLFYSQGVTLEDLKSAEQLVKKKQQLENQQRTSELQQLVASQHTTTTSSFRTPSTTGTFLSIPYHTRCTDF